MVQAKRFAVSTPIGHYILNRFYWMAEQFVFRLLNGEARYIENKQEEKKGNKKLSFLPVTSLQSNDRLAFNGQYRNRMHQQSS